MMNWKDIPAYYKLIATAVAATVFVLGYHSQFITKAEAAETQQEVVNVLTAMRVDAKEEKKERKIEEKAEAVASGDTAKAEKLEQEIQTLRDQIKGLCDQIDDC